MRDPGSGFARFHRARRTGKGLLELGSALGLLLLLGSCAASPSPRAAGPTAAAPRAPEPRRLAFRYVAPPPCPGGEGFVEHVQSRSTRLRLEPEPLAASLPEQVHVSVEPEASGEGWRGELRIIGAGSLVREVRGARCDDVVAALALITVLRLEPSDEARAGWAASAEATSAGARAPSVEASATVTTPTAPSPAAEAPSEMPAAELAPPEGVVEEQSSGGLATPDAAVEEPTQPAEAAVEEPPQPVEAAVEEPTQPVEAALEPLATRSAAAEEVAHSADRAAPDDATGASRLRVQTSVFGQLGYSSMPSHALKAALGAELRLGETATAWSGGLALALARGNDRSVDGTSRLTLYTAELRLCPPGISLDPGFSLRGCAQLSGGRLAVSLAPSRALATTDAAPYWVALGPSVDAGMPLSGGFRLHATSALMFHLIRDTFGRSPTADDADPTARVPLYRPEALSLELLLGIGYQF